MADPAQCLFSRFCVPILLDTWSTFECCRTASTRARLLKEFLTSFRAIMCDGAISCSESRAFLGQLQFSMMGIEVRRIGAGRSTFYVSPWLESLNLSELLTLSTSFDKVATLDCITSWVWNVQSPTSNTRDELGQIRVNSNYSTVRWWFGPPKPATACCCSTFVVFFWGDHWISNHIDFTLDHWRSCTFEVSAQLIINYPIILCWTATEPLPDASCNPRQSTMQKALDDELMEDDMLPQLVCHTTVQKTEENPEMRKLGYDSDTCWMSHNVTMDNGLYRPYPAKSAIPPCLILIACPTCFFSILPSRYTASVRVLAGGEILDAFGFPVGDGSRMLSSADFPRQFAWFCWDHILLTDWNSNDSCIYFNSPMKRLCCLIGRHSGPWSCVFVGAKNVPDCVEESEAKRWTVETKDITWCYASCAKCAESAMYSMSPLSTRAIRFSPARSLELAPRASSNK